MNLTRAKFDELTHDLVEKTAEPVRRALSDAGITASELGQVLLVGGSTRIPAVQDKVKQLTGKEQHITITAGSNMSDSEIDKAVKEAAEFEAQDKKRKEGIDTRNNADSMVFQVENALKEAGDKIDANDKAAVETDLNALKDLLAQTANAEMTDAQIADIKAAQEKMMESAQKLFAKMYEQTQQAGGQAGPNPGAGAGAGAAQGGNEAGYGDDVVDADYKEV